MALCPSGLLLSALILIIILNDLISYKFIYMIEHSILGAIACALFFTLCNYGLELVNWFLLALIPIYLFIRWVYTPPTYKPEDTFENECSESSECSDCSECENPKDTSKCSKPTIYEINIEKKKPVLCKSTSVKFNKSNIFSF